MCKDWLRTFLRLSASIGVDTCALCFSVSVAFRCKVSKWYRVNVSAYIDNTVRCDIDNRQELLNSCSRSTYQRLDSQIAKIIDLGEQADSNPAVLGYRSTTNTMLKGCRYVAWRPDYIEAFRNRWIVVRIPFPDNLSSCKKKNRNSAILQLFKICSALWQKGRFVAMHSFIVAIVLLLRYFDSRPSH